MRRLGGLRRGDLLAVALPPGPRWFDVLGDAWDAGAAVFPLDHRLPGPETAALLAGARPTAVFDGEDLARPIGGVPAAAAGGAGGEDDGIALVMASSGSAGAPRLAELTHAAVQASVAASAARLGATPDDPWLCTLPVAHMGGMLVLLRAVLQGASVAVHPGFEVEGFERDTGARFTSLVPTQLGRLLDAGADLARFRAIVVGGSRLPPDLAARAAAAGATIVATYGMTESSGGCVYDGVPLDGVEVRVAPDGEVLLRGSVVMRGYRLDATGTAQAFDHPGRWLRTRDAGEVIDGRLRILGRMDGLIVTGGEQVWPEEVETVLLGHAGIAEAAVAGREDPRWGERVVAFVVPADPARPPDVDAVRAHVGERLARHKVPKDLEIVAALPRSSLGKLRRGRLGSAERGRPVE